ncbi:MAG: GtrA family protein [Solimicrobium sp.]|jgi:putative flippase GtrA|nr:GtrA family protein [Solimicrobium sp.]
MLFSLKNFPLLRQFVHFAAVGLSGTSVQYLSLWIGVTHFLISAPVASAVGYLFGSVVNYLMNYLFTFRSNKSHKETSIKFFSVVAMGWCINLLLMSILVNYLQWYYWVAQIMATGIGLLWNFSGSKWWAFSTKRI